MRDTSTLLADLKAKHKAFALLHFRPQPWDSAERRRQGRQDLSVVVDEGRRQLEAMQPRVQSPDQRAIFQALYLEVELASATLKDPAARS
jgi:hypothetical protein